MKTIMGFDTKDEKDFGVIVTDKVYDTIKSFIFWYKSKHSEDVIDFLEMKNESTN